MKPAGAPAAALGAARAAARSARACSASTCRCSCCCPIAALLAKSGTGGTAQFWREVSNPEAVAAIKLTLIVSAIVVVDQRRLRHADRVGARARRIPGQERRQRADRPAVRAADDRRRRRAARALRQGQPGRHRRRLHARRGRRWRCCSSRCRSSCAPCSRCCSSSTSRWRKRPRRSARAPLTVLRRIVLPSLAPAIISGVALSFARARRRVRLARADHRQPAVQDRGRARSTSSGRSRTKTSRRPRPCRSSCCVAALVVLGAADASLATAVHAMSSSGAGRARPRSRAGARRARARARLGRARLGAGRARARRLRRAHDRARLPRAAAARAGGDDLLPHLRTRPRARSGDAITAANAQHAFWLSLEIVAIAVPLNTVFGDRHGAAARARPLPGQGGCSGC